MFAKGQINKDDPATAIAIGKALEEMFPGFLPILILCESIEEDGKTMLDPFTITKMNPKDLADFFLYMSKTFYEDTNREVKSVKH